MPLPVLTPVERRRRRRRSRRPRLLLLALLAAAVGIVAWQLLDSGSDSRRVAPATAQASTASAAPASSSGQAEKGARSRAASGAQAAAGSRVTAAQLVVVKRQPKARIVPPLTSRSAILIDGKTGEVLFWKNPHARVPIASVTKIMTALLAIERLKPRDIVTVAPLATRTPPTKEGLRPGERVEAWKLLYATMLFSGTDSALALGIAVGGTRERFLAMMNERARQLGLKDTHFNSTSGVVDEDNYSSAWDMAALSRVAMANPRFRAIVATKEKRVDWAPPIDWKRYVNHNKLVRTYDGADGIKTGWTTLARHTLAASARRNGTWLIGVTLGSAVSFQDMTRLLDLGFELRRT
jgi:D-alanyl-D-alanine carboxypeptidase